LEIFFLNLSEAANGVLAMPSAQCRILDDDPTPTLSIRNAMGREGSGTGTGAAIFEVGLSAPSSIPVFVSYATSNGAAIAGSDYEPVFGTLVFPPGTTNRTTSVSLKNDDAFEPSEDFQINLFAAYGAVLARDSATGIILDDDAGALDRFVWSEVPSPQYAGLPFLATITALDGLGRIATNFAGPVSIQAVANSRAASAGAGTHAWEQPLGSFFQDDRAQVIYLPEEIGDAGQINALSLRVTATPGQTLSNWTIRLKHTPLRHYGVAPAWESSGWTTVYHRDETLTATGWVMFLFSAPFPYNGSDALLADFSFNNANYSSSGSCAATVTVDRRAIYFQTDGAFGDPLAWSGTAAPPPMTSSLVPNARFTLEDPLSATPGGAVQIVKGVWSGPITVEEERANVFLRAYDGFRRLATGNLFDLDSSMDRDGDGLPDRWEERYFGSTHSPEGGAGRDPDGDGVTNLDEFRAGSSPLDPASAPRIRAVHLVNGDVHLFFASIRGKAYRTEYSDRMSGGEWSAVADPVPGTGGVLEVVHPGAAGAATRFYRVRVLP
jgi:hypothetical protein